MIKIKVLFIDHFHPFLYDNFDGKFTVTKGLTALTEADFTEITQQEVKAMFA